MKILTIKRIVSLCVFLAHSTQAVITQIYILHNPSTSQTMHLYGDKHISTSYAQVQRRVLLDRLSKNIQCRGARSVFCLVEDMMTPNSTNPELIRCLYSVRQYQNKNLQLLDELITDMRAASIPVYNIECRQLMETALQAYQVTATQVVDALYDLIRQLRTYSLPQAFRSIIDKRLTAFERTILYPLMPFLDQLRQYNTPLYQALEKTPYHPTIKTVLRRLRIRNSPRNYRKRKRFVLEFFDNELVNLVALAQIGLHPTAQQIIACAGAEHIHNIMKECLQLGFKLVAQQAGTVKLLDCNTRRDIKAINIDGFYQRYNHIVQQVRT